MGIDSRDGTMKHPHSSASRYLGLLLLLLLSATASANDAALAKQRIDRILAGASVRDLRAGVCVIDIGSGKPVYSLRADELFIPASNQKLLTTAAALDQLGADFRFITTFALRGTDLLLFASGDPGLGDERIARKHNTTIEAPFQAVVDAMKKAGVARVDRLLADITVFDTTYFHSNWPPGQRDTWYQAEVAGLNFNDNCVDLRCAPGPADGAPAVVEVVPQTRYVTIVNKTLTTTDAARHVVRFQRHGVSNAITASGNIKARSGDAYSVPITDPPAFALQALVDLLARNGIAVGKAQWQRLRQKDGSLPGGLTVLYAHSTTLPDLLWRANTFSQNFVAECLFKSLGAYDGGKDYPTGVGAWTTGRAGVAAFLKRQKLAAPAKMVIDDGSGLSKSNLVSPALLAQLLVRMAAHKSADVWFDSLASGGATSGTLRKRFRALDGDEMVLAKTGTLANAVALSGYVHTKANQTFAFSILYDGFKPGENAKARAAADAIVLALLGGTTRPD